MNGDTEKMLNVVGKNDTFIIQFSNGGFNCAIVDVK